MRSRFSIETHRTPTGDGNIPTISLLSFVTTIETHRTPAVDGNFDKKEKQRGTGMIEKNTIKFIENALKKGKKLQLEYNKKTGELKILELIPHIIFKENVKE